MPTKREQRADVNNFIQGLITEASPLNFPPNASAEEENFELNRDGSRKRRLGFDFEQGYVRRQVLPGNNLGDLGVSVYKWEQVAGDPGLEICVIQIGSQLHFYDGSAIPISAAGYLGDVVIGNFPPNVKYSMSTVEGLLVVVSGAESFATIEFNTEARNFTLSYDRIKIRDVFGVAEVVGRYEEDVSYRGEMDTRHYYNLQNQSWGIPRKWAIDARTSRTKYMIDPILGYYDQYGVLPGNGEQVWPGLQFQPQSGNETPYERIWFNLYEEVLGSEVSSAKGYYIIDALRRGVSRQEQVYLNSNKYPQLFRSKPEGVAPYTVPVNLNLPADISTGGPRYVAEFAGRLFFAGFTGEVLDGDKRSPNYSNYVFFSQLVKNRIDIAKCYQEGDPTGREAPDLIDTDGGFIRISEAVGITSLVNLGSQLIVLAKNGVWSINGGSDYGFSATNYKVTKLSTFGVASQDSVTVEGQQAFYWAQDGIYSIAKDQYGDFQVSSMTLTTIQSFYDSLPSYARETAFGAYDPVAKQVRWVYHNNVPFVNAVETKELVFDVGLKAFFINRIGNLNNQAFVFGALQASSSILNVSVEDIVVNSDPVIVNGDNVLATIETRTATPSTIKYITLDSYGGGIYLCMGGYNNTQFRDFQALDGIGTDAKAFCLTGDQTAGDVGIDKQVPYLTTVMKRTEVVVDANYQPVNESSCMVRCQWAFANGIQSNRWSRPFQVYRHRRLFMPNGPSASIDNGLELVVTKSKVRGRGEAFAFYFETEPYKDCHIIGWNITLNGNSKT